MTVKLVNEKSYRDSEEYLKRQQDVDAVLVLSKLLEPGMMMDGSVVDKARNKISSLIDKI